MNTIQIHDRLPITGRVVTDEGYVQARGTLARVGIQVYFAYELGLDGDPMRKVRIYRSPKEVFAPEAMASFEGQPITIDHPPAGLVNADNWSELAKGDARQITRNGNLLDGILTFRDRESIDLLNGGKVELSNGYLCQIDMTPGTTPEGEFFDGSQLNIRGNHIAQVDSARCGPACRVSDSQPHKEIRMTDALRKVVVDGIPLEVSDTAAAVIERLQTERQAALDATPAAVKAATDAHAIVVAAKDAEIEALKKDVMTPAQRDAMVSDWSKMIADAKRLAPAVTTDGKTCVAIRREVVSAVMAKDATAKAVATAVLAGKTIEAADADTVRATFSALSAMKVEDAGQNDAAARALAGKSAITDGAKPVGRAAHLQRLQDLSDGKKAA